MALPIATTSGIIKDMNINLKIKLNNELKDISAEIKGVDVYVETPLGRSVLQLKDKSELAAIEHYQQVIQSMADSYAALKNPTQETANEN